jgi:LPPG:FO 2-phospho-L-lactate transferase
MTARGHVLALCGGVGGAKLAFGLRHVLATDDLTIAVNTGDDFEHLGLAISPDLDTVTYTLAGLADRERGWGLAGETWSFMEGLRRLGAEDWFWVGDHDLALHVERTRRLAAGASLSEVAADIGRRLGLPDIIVPMSDDPVRTFVDTAAGPLAFQHYFVREQCRPTVTGVRYLGAESAQASPRLAAALARTDLRAIVLCPSNPYLSIGPILALPGVREAIVQNPAPCVAVSPIVGGVALKGPAAKLMRELGVEPSVEAVASHYAGLAHGLLLDVVDAGQAAQVEAVGLAAIAVPSVMRTDADRIALAQASLAFADALATQASSRVGRWQRS